MPTISKAKKDKISEQIIHYLFTISPESAFTSKISSEIARDEEFIKSIMLQLAEKKLVICIDKNPEGTQYTRRQRWRLSNEAFNIYKSRQSQPNNNNIYIDQDI